MKKKFEKKRYIPVVLLAVVIIAVLLFTLAHIYHEKVSFQTDRRVDHLLDYSAEYFGCLSGSGNSEELHDARGHCSLILHDLLRENPPEWTEELLAPIHMLMGYFYEYGRLPREPYEGIGDYATAMDAPLLAVTAEVAYERGLGDEYHQYMEDLIPYIVSDTKEGGFVLKYSNTEWWPLEYAWTTVTEQDAWFVLNGSLYGQVYIEMLKNLTGDPSLEELSKKALNAYKAKADEFLYPDGTWCYYSLNYLDGKRIINTIDKVSIEIDTLRSLYLLTGEPFYNEQLEIRHQLMSNLLPVYIVKDGDINTAMLLRACAPHPYFVDYHATLEFLDADGNVLATADSPARKVKSAYIMTEVPDGVTSFRLYRGMGTSLDKSVDKRLWAEGPVKYIEKSELATMPILGTWQCSYDAVSLEDRTLLLDPNSTEYLYGGAYYQLSKGQPYTSESYWLMEISNPTEETLPMRAFLYDENGTVMERTLISCMPGKNILLYSPLGYKDHDWPLNKAVMLSILIVTNELEAPVEVELGDVYYFHKTADIVNYLSKYEFSDFWIVNE